MRTGIGQPIEGGLFPIIIGHVCDEGPSHILCRDRVSDESRLAVAVGQGAPKALVQVLAGPHAAHFSEGGDRLAGALALAAINLTGGCMRAVEQHLQSEQEGR